MSSNHNLLPGLPPLDGHGGGGDTPSVDVPLERPTRQWRAVPDAAPMAAQTPGRPWPPTPPSPGAASAFDPAQSGEWPETRRVEALGSTGRWQAVQQPAPASATGSWEAIVADLEQSAGRPRGLADAAMPAWDSDAELVELCRTELAHVQRELDELRGLVKQSSRELEKLNQRKVLTADKVRQMEGHLEHHTRKDIRTTYLEAAEAEMRAFMMNEQRDQMEAKLRVFERYAQFLTRAMDALPARGASQAMAEMAHGAWPDNGTAGWDGSAYIATGQMPMPIPMPLPALPMPMPQPEWPLAPLPPAMAAPLPPVLALPPGMSTASQGTDMAIVARVIAAQESVRQRLAQRLHDGPTQSLANVMLAAEICEKLARTDPEQAKNELANLKGVVSTALQETRKFIFELRPMTLDDLGLIATVKRYALDIGARYQVQVPVTVPGGERRLPQEVEVPVFRVAQEAITNAIEHGRATTVFVTISLSSNGLTLTVEDNGGGFEVEPALERARMRPSTGVASMLERAELLGGRLRIESAAGRGTRLELSVPL